MRWNYTKSGLAVCAAGLVLGIAIDLFMGHEIGGPQSGLGRTIGIPLLALPVLALMDARAAWKERRESRGR